VKELCKHGVAASVVLLHVVNKKRVEAMAQGVAWAGETALEFEEEIKKRLIEEAAEKLEKMKGELSKAEVKTVVEYGSPVKKIIEVTEKEGISLIVMGSHGRGRFEELLLGSVSEGVIRFSKVPVFIVKKI